MTDLRIRRGDTAALSIVAVQADGVTPQSLIGATLKFTAKAKHEDTDAAAVIAKSSPASGITIDNAAGGLATVTLAAGDTSGFTGPRTLQWDVQMSTGAGLVKTLDEGLLFVVPDITRT